MRNILLIGGTPLVGIGDQVDPAKMVALPAGSFVSVPAGLHHYARANTILQIHGVGPSSMPMVKM
ncbi:MAG TPA: hypothetical protein VGG89_00425 [Candidatus Baltobacteraceae bacterium]|jgi:hypothetical protein